MMELEKLSSFKYIYDTLFDFLFPPRCPACGAYVESRGGWCPACLAATLRVRRLPLSVEHAGVLAGAWAFGLYHGALRELLLPLKFKKRRDGLAAIHSFLAAAEESLPFADCMPEIVVPVPLFAEKEKERGGNQTEMIFRDWLTAQGWVWRRALIRTRATVPQYGLSAVQRVENIKGAFSVADDLRADEIVGKHVLLVDDIFTTGATIAECARVLRKAGAAEVVSWTLASDRQ